jgi:hypothetical protein
MSRIAQLALSALPSPQAPATACCLPCCSTGTRIQDPARTQRFHAAIVVRFGDQVRHVFNRRIRAKH